MLFKGGPTAQRSPFRTAFTPATIDHRHETPWNAAPEWPCRGCSETVPSQPAPDVNILKQPSGKPPCPGGGILYANFSRVGCSGGSGRIGGNEARTA